MKKIDPSETNAFFNYIKLSSYRDMGADANVLTYRITANAKIGVWAPGTVNLIYNDLSTTAGQIQDIHNKYLLPAVDLSMTLFFPELGLLGGTEAAVGRGAAATLGKMATTEGKAIVGTAGKGIVPGVVEGAAGKATQGVMDDVAKIIAPAKRESGTTVLGKFPEYVEMSEELMARRFQIPPEIWQKMTEQERWMANQKFLDRTIGKGDEILLSSPIKNISEATGSFRKELEYLTEHGYKLNESGTKMTK
jgi:hypothetical protein